MLDADSVFERLLREATNLVPKMSTPKLTVALKVSSALQQRITDTLSSRLRQEQSIVTAIPAKSFGAQGVQSIVGAPVISEEIVSDNPFIASAEGFPNRTVAPANYAAIPFFPHLNQFAVGQRAATLVTITSPHGGTTGAVVGTLGPPQTHSTPLAPPSSAQPVIVPLQTAPQPSDPSTLQSPPSTSSKPDGSCDPCPPLITTTVATSATSPCAHNGHILTATGLECVDTKPDPVACLSRVAAEESSTVFTASSTTTTAGEFGASNNASLGFLPVTGAVAPTSPSISATTSTDNVVVPIAIPSIAATSATTTVVTAGTPTTVVVMKATSGNDGDCSGGGSGGAASGGPYQCMHCGKEFRVLRYLEKHKRIHTGEKPYQCCFCGRLFNDWPNMNRHKRIHTGERPYRCSVCTKTFSQPAVYNEHVKRHTGERPYVCTVCSKGFPRAARLAVHMRVHTGEKPYRCHVCDRRFSQPHHLSTHIRIHSGDRPFRFPLRDGSGGGSANSRRHRGQANHTTDSSIVNVATTSTPSPGNLVKPLSDTGITKASPNSGKRKLSSGDNSDATQNDRNGACSADSALHPESGESLLSQDGDMHASTNSSVETSCKTGGAEGAGLTSSAPLSVSTVTAASPSNAEATTAAAPNAAVASAGLAVSEDFCVQPPPPIFDPNGTIYISTMDGTAAISGGVSTALVPATTTITSTLPQIQIHPQPQPSAAAFAAAAAVFPGDPHHLQSRGPIQICYSTSPASTATANPNANDPATIILPPSKPQMFGPMLVPIGAAAASAALPTTPLTPTFSYATTAAANPTTAFHATHTLPPQAVVTKPEAVATSSSMEATSITADV